MCIRDRQIGVGLLKTQALGIVPHPHLTEQLENVPQALIHNALCPEDSVNFKYFMSYNVHVAYYLFHNFHHRCIVMFENDPKYAITFCIIVE